MHDEPEAKVLEQKVPFGLTGGASTFPRDGDDLEELLARCRQRMDERRGSLHRQLKLEGLPLAPAATPTPKTAGPRGVLPRSERFDDAVAALVRLGYTAPQAQEVVRQVGEGLDEASAEDLVRRSLAKLGKAAVTR